MHLLLGADGQVISVGPTLQKLCPDGILTGRDFFEIFAIERPRRIESLSDLRQWPGTKLHLRLRGGSQTELKGVLAEGMRPDTLVVNLSFGVSIVDAVRDFSLTAADFAPTDLAVEMLYLIEAKSSAMKATSALNQRLQAARRRAEKAAVTDVLTGLKNRRAIGQILERLVRQKIEFAVMNVDLDYFKEVNDTLGHGAGDTVLQTVAGIMLEEIREHDAVARMGGDEFLIVLAGGLSDEDIAGIGQRIIERVQEPVDYKGKLCRISASIGVTQSRIYDRLDLDRVHQDADIALYESKRRGRARVTFYKPDLRKEVGPDPLATGRIAP
ncbi:GGDEF domain-containing protein [Sulfitobacter sp. LCG007]